MKYLSMILCLLLTSCGKKIYLPESVEDGDQVFNRKILFTKVLKENEIIVSGWRELEAEIINGQLYIRPQKNGEVFSKLKLFKFKNTKDIAVERIHYGMLNDDYKWMNEYDKKQSDSKK